MRLHPLLNPRSIAVVGASDRPGAGTIVLDNLRQLGFPGEVYPVNPKYQQLAGWRCYPSLGDIPGPVDSVAILLSYRQVLPVLEQAASCGIHAAWSLASGFAEAGPEGEALQREVSAFCSANDIALCGPNCVGVINLHARMATYSVALPPTIHPGHVGAVLQSGAVCLGVVNSNRGIGFSTVISSGNEAVVDSAEYMAHLVNDTQTRVIIAFIEGFKNPPRFVEVAQQALAAGKPLLVVKVGRSVVAQRATLAHTGSLAGKDEVQNAMFRKTGVVRLESLDELLEAAELFQRAPLPQGRGVALLTLSGGQIGLIGDLAQDLDLTLAELDQETRTALAGVLPGYSNIANPLDAWGSGNFEETYPACIQIVARDPAVDLIAVARDSSPGIAQREVWQSSVIVEAAGQVARTSGKPVVVFSNVSTGIDATVMQRAEAASLPLLQGTRESLRAIEAFVRYAEQRRGGDRSGGALPADPLAQSIARSILARQPASVGEYAGKQILAAYGIPVAREEIARSVDDAVDIALAIGAPVALKIHSPDIQHKTEAGGVSLNLVGSAAVRAGYTRVIESTRAYAPGARIDGVLVQEMVSTSAIETIVGSFNDPEFGPVVVFGMGGILVELLKDSVLRLAPVNRHEAEEMITATKGAALLRGYRGQSPSDIGALADTIVRVSQIAHDLRDAVSAIDLNPLMVLPVGQGVRAVDALIVQLEAGG